MIVVQWASALLTLLCVALAAVAGVANGLLVLAVIFAATYAWSVGAFSINFWIADEAPSQSRLDALDGK